MPRQTAIPKQMKKEEEKPEEKNYHVVSKAGLNYWWDYLYNKLASNWRQVGCEEYGLYRVDVTESNNESPIMSRVLQHKDGAVIIAGYFLESSGIGKLFRISVQGTTEQRERALTSLENLINDHYHSMTPSLRLSNKTKI